MPRKRGLKRILIISLVVVVAVLIYLAPSHLAGQLLPG